MPDKPRIFISYFRKDGLDFARGRRKKLERKGFSLWQDIISLEGGRDFWLQITDALDHVEFMVLVLTDGAMQSPIVRKEWRYARQQGVCVYPVKGEPFSQDIHQSLSRWMRDAHYYDFDIEEQWQKLINDLHKSCETVRVPFMVEDKPDDFVEPPEEFNQLLALLLDPKREEPIAITAALRGAGSYGKNREGSGAKALCHPTAAGFRMSGPSAFKAFALFTFSYEYLGVSCEILPKINLQNSMKHFPHFLVLIVNFFQYN